MRSAEFNRMITIEQKSVTQESGYGTDVVTWAPLVEAAGSPTVAERFPAHVMDMLPSRSEAVANGLERARNQTRIRIRYRTDVDSSMRITVHGDEDTVYQIVGGPAEVGKKRYIEMVCERYSS